MDCIFCKIIKGEIPSYTVYEDDFVKCFLDINPDCDGHMLIVPKNHVKDLDEIDNDTMLKVIECARKMKQRLEDKLKIDGLTLVQNNGSVQEVKHFHLHLKPHYKDKESIEIVKHSEFINDPKDIYEILKEN